MNLKNIAKPHTVGGITWLLVPFETHRDKHVFRAFTNVLAYADWDTTAQAFFITEASAVDASFAGVADPAVQRFKEYWQSRPASMADRWFAFSMYATEAICDGIFEAYNATRDTQIETPVVNDPNSSAAAELNTSNGGG